MEIELTYRAEMALYRLFGIKGTSYAKISFTTLPGTSVRRNHYLLRGLLETFLWLFSCMDFLLGT